MKIGKRYRSVIVFILVITGLFIFIYLQTINKERKLNDHKKQTVGYIQMVEHFPRGDGLWVWYTYKAADNSYKKKYHLYVNSRYRPIIEQLLRDKHLPVVYDSTDYESSDLLLSSDDFKKYDIQQPDSLKEISDKLMSLKH